jgi:hypothetical protein
MKVFLSFLIISTLLCSWGCQHVREDATQEEESLRYSPEDLATIYQILPPPAYVSTNIEASGTEQVQVLIPWSLLADDQLDSFQASYLNGLLLAETMYAIAFARTELQEITEILNKRTSTYTANPDSAINLLAQRFHENTNRRDSLEILTTHLQERILMQRNSLAEIKGFLLGQVVENLYLTGKSLQSYPYDINKDDSRLIIVKPLLDVWIEQGQSLDQTLMVLESDSIVAPSIMGQLRDIQNQFSRINPPNDLAQAHTLWQDSSFFTLLDKSVMLRENALKSFK